MTCVLDASALLAAILEEDGADFVARRMANSHMTNVNLSEALAKLIEYRLSPEQVLTQIDRLEIHLHNFTRDLAIKVAHLREPTRALGLSLGDRTCLALGQALDLPILTSDRHLASANVVAGVRIEMIR